MKVMWIGICVVLACVGVVAMSVTPPVTMAQQYVVKEEVGARMVMRDLGFQTPESVLYDAVGDLYLVSNINGNPTATDGNGFITRVLPDGKTVNQKWIDGTKPGVTLNAPKGMAIFGDTLYVADITAVRMFNRATGEPKGSIDIPGSTFLNDVDASKAGLIYVTDSGLKPDFSPSGTDAVYRITQSGTVDTLIKDTKLKNPNGVLVLPDGRLAVVTFGKPGEGIALTRDGKIQSRFRFPAGQLDGIVLLPNGTILVSSWEASALFRLQVQPVASFGAGGGMYITKAATGLPSPADLGYDPVRNRTLVPLFTKNQVAALLIPEPLPLPTPREAHGGGGGGRK